MYFYLLLFVFIASTLARSAARFDPNILNDENFSEGILGVVEPVTNCGGAGQFKQLRISGCSTPPCDITSSTTIELDLTPNRTSFNAKLKFTAGTVVGEKQISDALIAGLPFTLAPIEINAAVSGVVLLKLEIINDSNQNEVCISLQVNFPTGTTTTTPRTTTTVRTTTTPRTTTTARTTTTLRTTTTTPRTTTTLRTTTTTRRPFNN